jgi:hypothetical protein
MSESATIEQPAAKPPEAKPAPRVAPVHPWIGSAVFYWRIINQATGEIGALPAMLLAPTRGTEGSWDLNFWQPNRMQGRQAVRFSREPAQGCWTWPDADAAARAAAKLKAKAK